MSLEMSFFLENKLGFDEDGCYDGNQCYFWAYEEHLMSKLRVAGVHWVLENQIYGTPYPAAAYRHRKENRDDRHDEELIDQFETEYLITAPLIGKAYGIIIDSLSYLPLESVRHILNDPTLDGRRRVQNIVNFLRARDGAVTSSKIGAIEREIDRIPPATDGPSAQYLMVALLNLSGILRRFGGNCHYSDERLRIFLLKSLHDPIFAGVIQQIVDNPDMPLIKIYEALQKAIHVLEDVTRRKRPSENEVMRCATIKRTSSSFVLSSICSRNSSLPLTHQSSSNSNPQILGLERQSTCWNCSSSDHFARDCNALHCNNCGCFFQSRDVPGYHLCTNCPYAIPHCAIPPPPPFVRSKRGRSAYRGGTVKSAQQQL